MANKDLSEDLEDDSEDYIESDVRIREIINDPNTPEDAKQIYREYLEEAKKPKY